MSKFKVGDIISEEENGRPFLRKIIGIENSKYIVDQEYRSPCGYTAYRNNYPIQSLDSVCKLYYRIIKSTKLARKVHANKIDKEEGGYLWVKY